MSGGNEPSHPHDSRQNLKTGPELHAWRTRLGLSARELAQLISVTERSIHRAEKSAKLGTKVKLAMELLRSRLEHGEIELPLSLGATSRRGRPPKEEAGVVREEAASPYGTHWHGELRTGADLRRWRNSIGLYQKELAKLLDVDVATMVRAEQSETPSSRLIYGAELIRRKLHDGELALFVLKKDRLQRGRPKKQQ